MTARFLVLLRHAKAESPSGTADEQRSLSARGHVDARAAGAWLAGRYVPELVLCSPSKRTRQTWHGVATSMSERTAPGAGDPAPVRYEPRLYRGGVDDLLATVREADEAVRVLLLIGHNPSLSQLAFDLDPDRKLDSDGLRTCGIAVHEVDGGWDACGPGNTRVAALHTARAD